MFFVFLFLKNVVLAQVSCVVMMAKYDQSINNLLELQFSVSKELKH